MALYFASITSTDSTNTGSKTVFSISIWKLVYMEGYTQIFDHAEVNYFMALKFYYD